MGRSARAGILGLMVLAIGLARLVEVELDPGAPPPIVAVTPPAPEESPGPVALSLPGARPVVAPVAAPTSPDAEPPVTVGLPAGRVHVVAAGETLGTIARKVYGSSRHWKTILDANKDVMATPEKMRVGMRLRLPDPPSNTHAGSVRR
jgi:nucleoid-associated protein YgaU